ncbi:hypothetical protein BDK51DRAFT_39012 [Blyttiomyces helicus]|uniref:Stretch-activated Ca2+-permeable channel component-domain-containing protein n=1 Tax=Blyttiomyces helicus TaxID=388810 RepID=A0A4P9W761_9FUNG|nr:hypothetical protein BDK51DRAFT_39012 [Blyttiomyces helicus]|eukprot:RKO87892.1 hypothetical protein BDK51DRAFT_39012 [Blyttiomyces helicus]
MRSSKVVLVALYACASVNAQGFPSPASDYGLQLVGALPPTYPPCPEPGRHWHNPFSLTSGIPGLLTNVMTFTASFCTDACNNALHACATAVKAACRRKNFSGTHGVHPDFLPTLLNNQPGFQQRPDGRQQLLPRRTNEPHLRRGQCSLSLDSLFKVFCTPCGAQSARAFKAFLALYNSDLSYSQVFEDTYTYITQVLWHCPGGSPTPAANGLLVASPLSGSTTSTPSSMTPVSASDLSRLCDIACSAAINSNLSAAYTPCALSSLPDFSVLNFTGRSTPSITAIPALVKILTSFSPNFCSAPCDTAMKAYGMATAQACGASEPTPRGPIRGPFRTSTIYNLSYKNRLDSGAEYAFQATAISISDVLQRCPKGLLPAVTNGVPGMDTSMPGAGASTNAPSAASSHGISATVALVSALVGVAALV